MKTTCRGALWRPLFPRICKQFGVDRNEACSILCATRQMLLFERKYNVPNVANAEKNATTASQQRKNSQTENKMYAKTEKSLNGRLSFRCSVKSVRCTTATHHRIHPNETHSYHSAGAERHTPKWYRSRMPMHAQSHRNGFCIPFCLAKKHVDAVRRRSAPNGIDGWSISIAGLLSARRHHIAECIPADFLVRTTLAVPGTPFSGATKTARPRQAYSACPIRIAIF